MPDARDVDAVARQWARKAESDLTTAEHVLKLGQECPTDAVCFHAQQCVEKYLKAVLVCKQIDFPKTHSISEIMALVPGESRPELTREEQATLTDYATVARYPGVYDDASLAEAHEAVGTARRVRDAVRAVLPPAALEG